MSVSCMRSQFWFWIWFPMNFAKFVRTPFLQTRSNCFCYDWNASLNYNFKVNILTHYFLQTSKLKQHHCNNSWEFKILQQWAVNIYYCPPPTYQNWLLICETGNKWHMCKSVSMEVSGGRNELFWDAWLVPFFSRKTFLVNSLERTFYFRKQERTL